MRTRQRRQVQWGIVVLVKQRGAANRENNEEEEVRAQRQMRVCGAAAAQHACVAKRGHGRRAWCCANTVHVVAGKGSGEVSSARVWQVQGTGSGQRLHICSSQMLAGSAQENPNPNRGVAVGTWQVAWLLG